MVLFLEAESWCRCLRQNKNKTEQINKSFHFRQQSLVSFVLRCFLVPRKNDVFADANASNFVGGDICCHARKDDILSICDGLRACACLRRLSFPYDSHLCWIFSMLSHIRNGADNVATLYVHVNIIYDFNKQYPQPFVSKAAILVCVLFHFVFRFFFLSFILVSVHTHTHKVMCVCVFLWGEEIKLKSLVYSQSEANK